MAPQTYDEFSRNIVANSYLNCCICLKIKKYLMSLPHLPTSANFHQDIILHIQEVHQWRVRLMHNLIPVQSLNSFLLPNNQCKHIASRGVNIITVSVWIVFCKYCSHRILSPYRQSIISYKNQKHFNQFTMSLLFCVILFYIIFLPLFLPLSEFVNTDGTI